MRSEEEEEKKKEDTEIDKIQFEFKSTGSYSIAFAWVGRRSVDRADHASGKKSCLLPHTSLLD